MNKLKLFDALIRKMQGPKFDDAMDAFLTLVENYPDVVTNTVSCYDPLLLAGVRSAAHSMVTATGSGMPAVGPGNVTSVALLHNFELNLTHGMLFVDGRLVTIVFLPDKKIGLLSLIVSPKETRFTRMTLTQPDPSRN